VRAISQEEIPERSQKKMRWPARKYFPNEMKKETRVAQASSLWGLVAAGSIERQLNPAGWKPAPLKPEQKAISSLLDRD
jgi:hypothetical protein